MRIFQIPRNVYDNLKISESDLEAERKILLSGKFELLKNNNATCYNEIKSEVDKYKYRQYTQILRIINKVQDYKRNRIKEISFCVDQTFNQIMTYKEKINNAK